MEATMDLVIQRSSHSKIETINWDELEFGRHVSDHMFQCQFKNGSWQQPHILPFQNLSLSPLTLALHYGQSIFEGMKAFSMSDGSINIFRLSKHHERLNKSLHRMSMPQVPYELFRLALEELVRIDKAWVPRSESEALYIRPLIFASEDRFGVKVSEEYQFLVMAGPVPVFYPKPIRVKVEDHFIRAARGGTGSAKCAGNYGGAFYPTYKAREEGFDQVIWTDAFEHEYIEESGMMNLMFVIDGSLVTPPLSDSILDGVTRDSLLQVAVDMGLKTEVRPVSITEIVTAFKNKRITEAFGAGTAAVVAPIAVIGINGELYELPGYHEGSTVFRLKKQLEAIRSGKVADVHGWNHLVN